MNAIVNVLYTGWWGVRSAVVASVEIDDAIGLSRGGGGSKRHEGEGQGCEGFYADDYVLFRHGVSKYVI